VLREEAGQRRVVEKADPERREPLEPIGRCGSRGRRGLRTDDFHLVEVDLDHVETLADDEVIPRTRTS